MVRRVEPGVSRRRPDRVAVEEPLEIRLDGHLVATTMRTPGHDFELACGLCHTDGLLAGAPVVAVRYCATASAMSTHFNVVTVDTGGAAPVPEPRLSATTAACGLCGSAGIEALRARLAPLPESSPVPPDVLASVVARVAEAQVLFAATGGVHGAAAFDGQGRPVVVREDVGRHNAVDKVVGHLLLDGRLPAPGLGLFVSGRASFEILQKAWAAGFSAVVAVGAPSSMAVEAARTGGILLAGFVRNGEMNVYAEGAVSHAGDLADTGV